MLGTRRKDKKSVYSIHMTSRPFEIIDKSLDIWLKKYGLTVYTEYKDEEIRLIPIIDNQGSKYELSIIPTGDLDFKLNLFWADENDKIFIIPLSY